MKLSLIKSSPSLLKKRGSAKKPPKQNFNLKRILKADPPPPSIEPKCRTRYEKQKCAYHNEEGDRCNRNAVGKSTLCKRHGGNPIIKENLLTDEELAASTLTLKYDPTYHPWEFIELSKEGKSPQEIAAHFEISMNSLRGWTEKFQSFNTAFDIGSMCYEAFWLQKGKDNLENRAFKVDLFKFLTGNTLGYSDKVEQKSMNQHLHGVLLIPGKPDQDEWQKGALEHVAESQTFQNPQ